MTVLLQNALGDLFPLPQDAWDALLTLAQQHGWTPLGTVQPDGWWDYAVTPSMPSHCWDASYHGGAGQTVTLPDTLAMTEALIVALDEDATLSLEEQRESIWRFIAFAQQGGFTIW